MAKIENFLQLSSTTQDSGEICEVSTTVDKDVEEEESKDEVIDVENEEKKVKSEPQVGLFLTKFRPKFGFQTCLGRNRS